MAKLRVRSVSQSHAGFKCELKRKWSGAWWVAPTCNPCNEEAQREDCDGFEASLGYLIRYLSLVTVLCVDHDPQRDHQRGPDCNKQGLISIIHLHPCCSEVERSCISSVG